MWNFFKRTHRRGEVIQNGFGRLLDSDFEGRWYCQLPLPFRWIDTDYRYFGRKAWVNCHMRIGPHWKHGKTRIMFIGLVDEEQQWFLDDTTMTGGKNA